MQLVDCREVLGKDYFETYSEFIFIMCIGKEYYRRGKKLDISNMRIDDILGSMQKLMLKWLVYKDMVYFGESNDSIPEPTEAEPYAFNMDAITANEGKLFNNIMSRMTEDNNYVEGRYEWSNDWAKQQDYGEYDFVLYKLSELNTILLHIIAHLVVSIWEGTAEKKKIRIVVDGVIARSTDNYVNLVSCSKTISWFDKMIDLDIDYGDKIVDLDFSLFINNGNMAGRRKQWSIKDKQEFMKKEGIVEGSICILYERKGLAKINIVGRIVNANIVRVDKIAKDRVYVTVIPLYRTKEEVVEDFYEIPEDMQYMFEDMLQFKANLSKKVLSLYDLGISNYMYDEVEFITPIDKHGTVVKKITVDGVVKDVELSQIDSIYWLLCQYQVEFDRDLFKDMYNSGEFLLWDEYGSTVE